MIRLPSSAGAVAFLTAWLMPWRPVYRVRARDSRLTFRVHRKDAIGRHIAKYGRHEPEMTRWIADRLAVSPPGLFIDVGANIGWHALHAARHRAIETVLAFEPDPFNAWLLDRNLSENRIDKVIVSTCAIGARRGVARLNRYKTSNLGRHSLLTDHGHGSRTIPLLDLDGALEDLGFGERPIIMVKIDVEGYEPAVIAGASRTLARSECVILEYSPSLSRAGGLSVEDMLARLHEAGFAPYALGAGGSVAALDRDALRSFDGQMDVIWMRSNGLGGSRNAGAAAASAATGADRGGAS